jgi:hypothetical protein
MKTATKETVLEVLYTITPYLQQYLADELYEIKRGKGLYKDGTLQKRLAEVKAAIDLLESEGNAS